jgi:hypothetical protein
MGRRGRKAKDPFEDLDSEFKDAVASMKDEEIKTRIAQVAMDQQALNEAKKNDEDLKQRQSAVKVAMEPYRAGNKGCQLRIKYARMILDARGKEAGTNPLENPTQ